MQVGDLSVFGERQLLPPGRDWQWVEDRVHMVERGETRQSQVHGDHLC